MTAYDVLVGMDKLLAKKENWCQGEYAKSKTGKGVDSRSPSATSATSWCLQGAAERVARGRITLKWDALKYVELTTGAWKISCYNDRSGRKFSEIKKVIREAKRRAKLALKVVAV